MPSCSIKGCRKTSKRTLHRIPKDKQDDEMWLPAIERLQTELTVNSRICSKHFEQKFFEVTKRGTFLKKNAFPTLFDPSLKRKISKKRPEVVSSSREKKSKITKKHPEVVSSSPEKKREITKKHPENVSSFPEKIKSEEKISNYYEKINYNQKKKIERLNMLNLQLKTQNKNLIDALRTRKQKINRLKAYQNRLLEKMMTLKKIAGLLRPKEISALKNSTKIDELEKSTKMDELEKSTKMDELEKSTKMDELEQSIKMEELFKLNNLSDVEKQNQCFLVIVE